MSEDETHLDRALAEEFGDQAAVIHALKAADPKFRELMVRNHELWWRIQKIQEELTPVDDVVLEDLEKQRLAILDEIAARIRAAGRPG